MVFIQFASEEPVLTKVWKLGGLKKVTLFEHFGQLRLVPLAPSEGVKWLRLRFGKCSKSVTFLKVVFCPDLGQD